MDAIAILTAGQVLCIELHIVSAGGFLPVDKGYDLLTKPAIDIQIYLRCVWQLKSDCRVRAKMVWVVLVEHEGCQGIILLLSRR